MAMTQDSSDPTGIAIPEGHHAQPEAVRARVRKANAAYKMAQAGADYKQIARTCGYPSPAAARVAIEQMLEKRLTPSDKEHLRMMVAGRLDSLLKAVWAEAHDKDAPGQLVAVQRAREIIADYRRVYGVDAPQEILVTSPTQRDLDEFVRSVVEGSLPTVENFDIVEADVVEDTEEFDADAV